MGNRANGPRSRHLGQGVSPGQNIKHTCCPKYISLGGQNPNRKTRAIFWGSMILKGSESEFCKSGVWFVIIFRLTLCIGNC